MSFANEGHTNRGKALGVLAATHTFSAHMGWEDMATGMNQRPRQRPSWASSCALPAPHQNAEFRLRHILARPRPRASRNAARQDTRRGQRPSDLQIGPRRRAILASALRIRFAP